MEYICTICCKEKSIDTNDLPAIERYVSSRIKFVLSESQRLGKRFVILSGKYGLLEPSDKIPWYDQKLIVERIPEMVPVIVAQLLNKRVTKITFYGKPRTTSEWQPYYEALEKACRELGIPIQYRQIDFD